jgi:hypothetical protein
MRLETNHSGILNFLWGVLGWQKWSGIAASPLVVRRPDHRATVVKVQGALDNRLALSCLANVSSYRRKPMKRILFAAIITALAIGPAMAQETCASKAVDKNGKPLAGAALNSFLKKCKREACEPKAVSTEGKKLSGAAKNSFMQKCEKDA